MSFALILLCSGCAEHPTPGEDALISEVESKVVLPEGGGRLSCYARHYAVLQGDEIDDYLGVSIAGLKERSLLVGRYRLDENPGVYWAESFQSLPDPIMDGGCSDLQVFHVIGDHETTIAATCSLNIAGESPDEIDPPVIC